MEISDQIMCHQTTKLKDNYYPLTVYFLSFFQHQQKSAECKKRCVRAKNEYVLSLESTNRFLENYYNNFLGTLVDVSIDSKNCVQGCTLRSYNFVIPVHVV